MAAVTTVSRLTDEERRWRAVSETQLADQVIDLARILGWRSLVIRPARTKHGWVTPVAGDGKGWPDLTLLRSRDGRLVFAELKREVGGIVSNDQAAWLAAMAAIAGDWTRHIADAGKYNLPALRLEVHLWKPSDLADPIEASRIYEVLR
jgi:hypothetical protein